MTKGTQTTWNVMIVLYTHFVGEDTILKITKSAILIHILLLYIDRTFIDNNLLVKYFTKLAIIR